MYKGDCNKWVQGCSQWMRAWTKGRWDAYYIRFKMKACRRSMTVPQMHDWISWHFYRSFCSNQTC